MTRERRALNAAVLLSGSAEVTDFLLPLFGGASLGAGPAVIGLLLAAELAVSLLMRPVAGILADRWERRSLAACGASLYALACAGYALAATGGVAVAFVAAVVGGAGGALLWVSLRAMVGERLPEDSSVFARLLAAEEYGGWVVFVPAVIVVGPLGYPGTFLALAACCLAGAVVLMSAPRSAAAIAAGSSSAPAPSSGSAPVASRSSAVAPADGLLRRLSPMLAAVVLTMTAEAAIGLLLLLHLQNEFGLPPGEIAVVFLPGAIAMSVLPPYLHRWVTRFGRTRMVAAASVSSALFAASLAAAPHPAVIGLAWVLTAAAWAVVLPVQQAVVAEVAGPARLGRGLGWYESATLAGGLLGSLAAGFLYRPGWWAVACLVCSAMLLAGALAGPLAIRRLGVADRPPPPAGPVSVDDPPRPERGPASPSGAATSASRPASPLAEVAPKPQKSRLRLLATASTHAAAFTTVLLIAANTVTGFPLAGVLGVGPGTAEINPLRLPESAAGLLAQALRVWWIVLLVDVVWTLWLVLFRRR